MSSLNIISNEREIFKCPGCNQYTSLNTCPKCSHQVNDDLKQRLSLVHNDEVKGENNKFFMRFVYGGAISFAIGLLLVYLRLASDDELSSKSIVLTIGGLGSILWGLRGIYKD